MDLEKGKFHLYENDNYIKYNNIECNEKETLYDENALLNKIGDICFFGKFNKNGNINFKKGLEWVKFA